MSKLSDTTAFPRQASAAGDIVGALRGVGNVGIDIGAELAAKADGAATTTALAAKADAAATTTALGLKASTAALTAGLADKQDISTIAELIRDTIAAALANGTGITITPNDGADTISIATTITQYTDEMARDVIGVALTQGANITITPNDGADTITIAVTGITGYTAEAARDDVGAALVGGKGVKVVLDDAGDTITLHSENPQYGWRGFYDFNRSAAYTIAGLDDIDGSGLYVRSSGAGAQWGANNDIPASSAVYSGVATMLSGTTTGGVCACGLAGSVSAIVGQGEFRARARMALHTLSTAGQRYETLFGLSQTALLVLASITDFIGFYQRDDVNSGKWRCVTKSAATGATTNTDTNVTPVANTLANFDIVVNAAGTSIEFYIDGVLVATHTTNIPVVVLAPTLQGMKSVGTTTTKMVNVDYVDFTWKPTATR